MLTPKDVLYLEDVLNQMFVLSKRISKESGMLNTKAVLTCFEDVNKEIKKTYQDMLAVLEKEAKK